MKVDNKVIHTDGGAREESIRKAASGSANLRERSDATTRVTDTESLVVEKVLETLGKEGIAYVEQTGYVTSGCRTDRLCYFRLISGKVTVLAGNSNFWVVGCEDGCLQGKFVAATANGASIAETLVQEMGFQFMPTPVVAYHGQTGCIHSRPAANKM
ncbi:Hypothetical predicted protein [Olea europaea subsp. europaea]|uniref:Uncharacterized protein n=1 Tax=Olea europaea subsp. europaea TaxID=158383 RepID=A0A8S0PZN2_OLEEU|nr:Hypothetical predicted protein [Olea europaea subsp. europaea]